MLKFIKRASIVRKLGAGLVVTAVLWGAAEIALWTTYVVRNSAVTHVPLPYVIGDDYGPLPPWSEKLQILGPDPDLIWRNRPNQDRQYVDLFRPMWSDDERRRLLRAFLPRFPQSLQESAAWKVRLNSQGYRGKEVGPKGDRVIRIACLGDSWTFGTSVNQDQTYPGRLQSELEEAFPGASFEVLNFGVLAYSSFQGLQALKRDVLPLNPNVVVIGYAMNDSKVIGYRDKDMAVWVKKPLLRQRVERALEYSEFYRLLRYEALLLKYKAQPPSEYIRARASTIGQVGGSSFDELEPWTRVGTRDYEANIREMIQQARSKGASVILLYNEFWQNSPYLAALQRLSRESGSPLVDSSALLAEAGAKLEKRIESELGLAPDLHARSTASADKVEVVFRVFMGGTPVPKAVYISGSHPELGDLIPNSVQLYDDGTHGDQKAGDAVWSYAASFPPGTRLCYVYTNSGRKGIWEGLDVAHIREFTVPSGTGRVYAPVESFGKVYLHSDGWHPDADGYQLIARAAAEAVNKVSIATQATLRVKALPPEAQR